MHSSTGIDFSTSLPYIIPHILLSHSPYSTTISQSNQTHQSANTKMGTQDPISSIQPGGDMEQQPSHSHNNGNGNDELDESRLAQFGYKQELNRDWGLAHNFGVSFSIIVRFFSPLSLPLPSPSLPLTCDSP